MKINVRYAADLPVLRYIVPFSYAQNGMSYGEAKKKLRDSAKWVVGTRKDLVPSHEEDLYDHVYDSLLENDAAGSRDANLGMFFIPKKEEKTELVYSFVDDGEKKYEFSIKDV